MRKLEAYFNQEEKQIFREAESFHRILTHLRYEGKARTGTNVAAARKAAGKLTDSLKKHRLFQEKILFPFLKVHFPKYESALHYMESEHDDIVENKKKLNVSLRGLSRRTLDYTAQADVYQRGLYLVSLLRHHLRFENKTLQKTLRAGLKADEKREMARKLRTWLAGGGKKEKRAWLRSKK